MTDSVQPTGQDVAPGDSAADAGGQRLLAWLCAGGIGVSLLIMVAASLIRQDWMYPPLAPAASGPPFELPVPASGSLVSVALWLAGVAGAGGVAAGLLAVRRGARWPVPVLVSAGLVAALVLTLLPPAGSTDALDYAAYGRLAMLGHNPYVATPLYLRLTDPSFGVSIPIQWQQQVSLYGPAATGEQYAAALLGGNSMARVVFWLKLGNLIAFGAAALLFDQTLRHSLTARLRAHLLWTANPLLLWGLIAGGHLDVLAATAGVAALLTAGSREAGTPPGIGRAVAAGALVGVAADIKIDYVLFGLGLAWALRRSPQALLAATAGALAVLGPTYAWLGSPAFLALFAKRDKTAQDSFYRLAGLAGWEYLVLLSAVLFAGMATLLLRRLPPGDRRRPAIRSALGLGVAWLAVWPYTLPWYEAMIISALVVYPASRLDWLVLARLGTATVANLPGDPSGVPGQTLRFTDAVLVTGVAPALLLALSLGVVWLAVTRRWGVVPGTADGGGGPDDSAGSGVPAAAANASR